MKRKFMHHLMLVLLLTTGFFSHAQTPPPVKQWDKTIGGNYMDQFSALQQTRDGGYILGGSSYSGISGDKTDTSRGENDYWIVKVDANGNKQWDKTFGGNHADYLSSIKQTADGGYILGGSSYSGISGDKTEDSKGGYDYWVVKVDSNGMKQWDKTIGGSNYDGLYSLQQTRDGSYILGGISYSGISGDKTEDSKGGYDYWVVKVDANGNKQWDKTFGGASYDNFAALQQTRDGGYILGGSSNSGISGDKTDTSKGFSDYWIVKVDANGNKQWDKTFGGANPDDLAALQETAEGGFILGGYSESDISGDKTNTSKGYYDYWIVKIDASGNKQWDKDYGGSDYDELAALQQTRDGGYILGGSSFSGISGDKTDTSRGGNDYWVVKVDANGNKQWDKTFGGASYDNFAALQQTRDGGYILGGSSNSGISGDKTEANTGTNPSIITGDYWIVKLCIQRTFYRDNDSDGYGNASVKIQSCTAPAGYVLDSTDCNDSNAAVHPGAVEICGNGIDDNCNGQIDENCGSCRNATNLTTTNITASSATLNWAAPAPPQQWQVEYKSLSTGSKWTTITVSGTARSLTLTSLFSNHRYKWHIRAKCNGTWTAYSGEVHFTTGATIHSSITRTDAESKAVQEQETLVVPNLLHRSQLWRIPSLPAKNQIIVIDMNGSTVLHATNYANNKAFNNLAPGMYFYQIITADENGTSKTYSGKLLIVD